MYNYVKRGLAYASSATIAAAFTKLTYEVQKEKDKGKGKPKADEPEEPEEIEEVNFTVDTELVEKAVSSDNFSPRCKEIMVHGYPSYSHIKCLEDYVLAFDKRNNNPRWVCEHITKKSKLKKKDAKHEVKEWDLEHFDDDEFSSYDDVQEGYEKTRSDIFPAQFAIAENHIFSESAMKETLMLSNTVPEKNSGWLNFFANKIGEKVDEFTDIYICTGPLYIADEEYEQTGEYELVYNVIGKSNYVSIPTHFFKVVLGKDKKNKMHLKSYMWENDSYKDKPNNLDDHLVDLSVIERSTGLLFFQKAKSNLSFINKDEVKLKVDPEDKTETKGKPKGK